MAKRGRPRGISGKKISPFLKLEKKVAKVLKEGLESTKEATRIKSAEIISKYLPPSEGRSSVRYEDIPWDSLTVEQYERLAEGEEPGSVVR